LHRVQETYCDPWYPWYWRFCERDRLMFWLLLFLPSPLPWSMFPGGSHLPCVQWKITSRVCFPLYGLYLSRSCVLVKFFRSCSLWSKKSLSLHLSSSFCQRKSTEISSVWFSFS
jgi:hypothetical protein